MDRAGEPDSSSCCWVTQITTPSYLPGAIVLAYSLRKQGSRWPIVIQYTQSVGEAAITALCQEAELDPNIIPCKVDFLQPRQGQENVGSVAERFKDTFTKLRAFEVYKLGFDKACFLDADMAAFQNPDQIMAEPLAGPDWLGANHACVCNLDNNEWAPKTWHKGNCVYTTIRDPEGHAKDLMVPECRPTYRMFNGGMFLFNASRNLWLDMLSHFNDSEKLRDFQFPDQDFLADFFYGKIEPLSWKYNAIKTMRYWHPAMWSDEKVIIVHYIVDKPWERRVSVDGIAGHLGRDGETHKWWWVIYEDWAQSRHGSHVAGVLASLMETHEPFTEYVPLSQEPGTLTDVTHSDEIEG